MKPKIKWYIRWDKDKKAFVLIDDQKAVRGEEPQYPGRLAEKAFELGADEVVHQYDHIAVALGLGQEAS